MKSMTMVALLASAIIAVAIIAAAFIMRPHRYKAMSAGEGRSIVLDTETGLVYPRGTGCKPLEGR